MGGDGLDERVFATVATVRDHGGDAWWLHLSKCTACGQHWMIAQEERIFDEHFMRRMDGAEAGRIIAEGRWPAEFLTYERVLKIGHTFVSPCIFLEPLAASLIWSAEDLRKERPDISVEEIAQLLGVSAKHAARLLAAKEKGALPASIEGLLAYIRFPWVAGRAWFVPTCLLLSALIAAFLILS